MNAITPPLVSLSALGPEMTLLLTGVVVMLLAAMAPGFSRLYSPYLSLAGVLVALYCLMRLSGTVGTAYDGMLTLDSYGFFFRFVFLLVAAAAVLISISFLSTQKILHGEFYALLLFSVVGMMSIVTSKELLVIFLGIEILSVGLYAMAGFQRENLYSVEAAVKYFLLGAFSTSFFLFGIALVYGATGTTFLPGVASRIATGTMPHPEYIGPGLALLLVGFLFKISAFPFHMWTPDVYQGAPTPVTAFMAVGPKMAGFAALARVLLTAFPAMEVQWRDMAIVISACTMVIGNFAALRQNNIKRMLAYSSIAHVGYLLMAFVAGNPGGVAAMMFYLVAYAAMNFAAFGAVIGLVREDEELVDIDRYGGLGFKSPVIGAVLAISLLSLAGIPPTAGFFAKFFVFKAALQGGHTYLVVFAVLNSALSFYYYIRPVIFAYMKPETAEITTGPAFFSLTFVLAVSTFFIVWFGIYPAWLYERVTATLDSLYRLAAL